MARFSKQAMKNMPPVTREIAKTLNEVASAHRKLYNRVEKLGAQERGADKDSKAQDFADQYRAIVGAACRYVDAVEAARTGRATRDAYDALYAAVAPLRVSPFEDAPDADSVTDGVDVPAPDADAVMDVVILQRARALATARNDWKTPPPTDDVKLMYERLLVDPDYQGGRWDGAAPDAPSVTEDAAADPEVEDAVREEFRRLKDIGAVGTDEELWRAARDNVEEDAIEERQIADDYYRQMMGM